MKRRPKGRKGRSQGKEERSKGRKGRSKGRKGRSKRRKSDSLQCDLGTGTRTRGTERPEVLVKLKSFRQTTECRNIRKNII